MQRPALLLLLGYSILFSCSRKIAGGAAARPLVKDSVQAGFNGQPDYSNLFFWAAHPDKKDASDSIPRDLAGKTIIDSTVDVFFLHPTTLTAEGDSSHNASLGDAALNAKTDKSSILYQASAFNECRVFAPRYRQAHYRNYFMTDSIAAVQAFDLAYEDIKASFQYYLDHFNQGRPIIIAAHSQGSTHAQRLLKDFFENSPLKDKLVVAYILGMYIPADYFSALSLCKDSTQTGCLVAWRTYKNGYIPAFVKKEKTSGMVTNPLSWTTTEDYAPYALNKGAVISDFNRLRVGITDARIHENILWIHRPRIAGSIFLRIKNFHIGDINLFYMNIRENMRCRIRAYKERN